ncbi:copper transpport protein [Entomophthora muscae]|uniref:Copper transpport protein n=1 Tax=Entomophthora muscae TaxID=34485 RepID=A0ACC2TXD6_9FUNG|nr:copper transpport protein [Entomophthora muscae]
MDSHQMPMDGECQMMMTLNWETKNICVVVEDWKINAVGYELLRGVASNLAINKLGNPDFIHIKAPEEERLTNDNFNSASAESSALAVSDDTLMDIPRLNSASDDDFIPRSKTTRLVRPQVYRSILYGAQVFYSFLLMLIFMTYNGFLMLSVALGAGIGNYYASRYFNMPTSKSVSCH